MDFATISSQPIASLTTVFATWKALLLAAALGNARARDYDTSTSLFFERLADRQTPVSGLVRKLTRWDALYYVHSARDGYVYEQEWAFGAALPMTMRAVLSLPRRLGLLPQDSDGVPEAFVGIVVAHLSHLVAVLALYRLTHLLSRDRRLSLVASMLHIFSPAGVFLSAPYGESPFACLSFVGSLVFATGLQDSVQGTKRALYLIGAGLLYGVGTTFRSNGVLYGLLFAAEALRCLLSLGSGPTISKLIALGGSLVGGLGVAAGFVAPQFVAWQRYCGESATREWCNRSVPSIFAFVQAHYWDVGLFKYWTVSQLPLFMLASPVLIILILSGTEILQDPSLALKTMLPGAEGQHRALVRALAAGQVILAVLALTTYHVQIITRISSGYPVWYWWISSCLQRKDKQKWAQHIVVFMMMYAGAQCVLFSSFLPPA